MIKKEFSYLGLGLLATVIVGICVSIVTTISTQNWLNDYHDDLQSQSEFSSLLIENSEPIAGTYEESLRTIADTAANSLAYLRKKTNYNYQPDNWLVDDKIMATGVAITIDGWLVFAADAMPRDIYDNSDNYLIWINGNDYELQKVIMNGDYNLAMIKIDGQNLNAVDFGNSANVVAGSIFFAATDKNEIYPLSLVDNYEKVGDIVNRAEDWDYVWRFDDKPNLKGVPLLNGSGALMGFYLQDGQALPIHQVLAFIKDVIQGEGHTRAALGVYVLDVDTVYSLNKELLYGGYKRGALVYTPSSGRPAVAKGSPAEKAGIKENDLILSINRDEIAGNTTLADLLSLYSPGDTVLVEVLNDDGLQTIEVELADYNDINY